MRTVVIALTLGLCAVTPLQAQPLTGQVQQVTIARGDTLRSLGSRLGIDPLTIARDNGLTLEAVLPVGTTLQLDIRHIVPSFPAGVAVLVNVPQRMLFVASNYGVLGYPVAVGRASWPTPLGEFSIASKETNPTWDVPESIREEARRAGRSLPMKVPPGPQNPLGAYWLGLSLGSIGIHGTNAPSSVYQAVTHGCIRMQAADVEALFPQVPLGARGVLTYQPILMAVAGNEVFLEVHRDIYRRGPHDSLAFVRAQAEALGVLERLDWDAAAKAVNARAGVARAITRQ
jgi:L,D-transpeptidase ErfK/SrfK